MAVLEMPAVPRAAFRALVPLVVLLVFSIAAYVYANEFSAAVAHVLPLPGGLSEAPTPPPPPPPRNSHLGPPAYRPTPTYTPPAATDPFPMLTRSTGAPPPIPPHNRPRPDMFREYGLDHAPPLFIGFTRNWAVLLQAVVSYVTSGWPPESIYIVENTGVQAANAEGRLSLQNPFHLNHTSLQRLGVNVVRTPVLLSFAQLQNFFLHLAHEHGWRHYFYSHQDVLVFSFEDGADATNRPGDRPWDLRDWADDAAANHPPPAGQAGYRTLYENCLRELNRTLADDVEPWAWRWFQYDHLTLVNRAALDAVGGWDALIPYYMTDCDMNARLKMEGYTMLHRRAGIVNDVASTLEDLAALYRVPGVVPRFVDPNPFKVDPPPEEEKKTERRQANGTGGGGGGGDDDDDSAREYFRALVRVGNEMGKHKYGNRGRNTWQVSQRGGFGEPYYYDPVGFANAFDVLTEAGREVYRRKWGHRDCDIVEATNLKLWDQWRVEKDWE
jgi:hypothetical protein